MLKVFGHLSPDTDATCSAILWAWYLNNHTSHQATPFVLGGLNKETSFVLERWGVPEPELLESIQAGEEVVIVDTNSPQELFSNISEANITNIIDHHKLTGGISTPGPIEMTLKTLASTSTVIYDLMGEKTEMLPDNMAGILLSGILSDTLAFRSPTTTSHDKEIAEKLARKLKINISKYSDEMFAAKSDVSDFTDIGLIHLDSKKHSLGDKNIRVSVLETTNPDSILLRKAGLVEAIKSILKEEKDVDDVLLFIIDIFKEEATVLTYNQLTKDIIEASFGVTVHGDTKVLPGILSRKKQIFPVLQLPKKN
ncbi:MAG TPA: manganese-dependent inorganic pyrophosphatase [Candidatus Paceibacterota bacterium]|nr:manganese-dependent inorganic pyrophosphatase [Candidatus Paceibacterota bacterium]